MTGTDGLPLWMLLMTFPCLIHFMILDSGRSRNRTCFDLYLSILSLREDDSDRITPGLSTAARPGTLGATAIQGLVITQNRPSMIPENRKPASMIT